MAAPPQNKKWSKNKSKNTTVGRKRNLQEALKMHQQLNHQIQSKNANYKHMHHSPYH